MALVSKVSIDHSIVSERRKEKSSPRIANKTLQQNSSDDFENSVPAMPLFFLAFNSVKKLAYPVSLPAGRVIALIEFKTLKKSCILTQSGSILAVRI